MVFLAHWLVKVVAGCLQWWGVHLVLAPDTSCHVLGLWATFQGAAARPCSNQGPILPAAEQQLCQSWPGHQSFGDEESQMGACHREQQGCGKCLLYTSWQTKTMR